MQGELLAKQFLEANFPDLDLREGTGLRDLTIRPLAMAFGLLDRALDSYFAQSSISQVTDSTSTELVDSLMSNLFLQRKVGTRSVINARLYFARQKNTVITADTFFSIDNTLKFQPDSSVTVAAAAMQFDSYANEYYVDVDLTAAAEGSAYNLSSGSLLYFTNFDPYFLRAEINYLKSASISSETNTQFVTRAKTAISTRNLINSPSISARLQETFNYITRLISIGKGDPEMWRDQILAVFNPEAARTPSAVALTVGGGTTVQVTLVNHGFVTGQTVTVSGATPSGYNGTYPITSTGVNTFTYVIPVTQAAVTVLPSVQSVTAPTYIHNGGCVDVYCSDVLASTIVQTTLDSTGSATITGPIMSWARSSVSGGGSADTVPQNVFSTIASIAISGSNLVCTTTTPHVMQVGDTVTLTGIRAYYPMGGLQSVSLVGTTLTVALNVSQAGGAFTPAFRVGDKIKLYGYTGPGVTATVNESVFYDGVERTISAVGVDPGNGHYTVWYTVPNWTAAMPTGNGIIGELQTLGYVEWRNYIPTTAVITATTTSTFTFANAMPTSSFLAFQNNPTMSASIPTRFSVSNKYQNVVTGSTITRSGTTVTVQANGHGLIVGRTVKLANTTEPLYDGLRVVSTVLNANQFTFEMPTASGNASISTSFTVTTVNPYQDYGFSQRQALVVNFGSTYAGGTASLQVKYFDNISSIQTYLDDPSNRIMCGDYLARGFNVVYLNVTATSYNTTAPDSAVVTTVVQSYLSSLSPGDMFIMSDLVTKLRAAGIANIKTPLTVTYTSYTKDLLGTVTGTITDVMDPNDRTAVFLLASVTTNAQSIGVGSFVPAVV